MERRWGNRVVLDETVTVRRDGDGEDELLGFARLHDVSLSGAFLETDWNLPHLARVYIEIPCPHLGPSHPGARRGGSHSRPEFVEAFVVRHCSQGLCVEWCEFAPPEVAAVMEARRQLPPPVLQADAKAHARESHAGRRRRLR